jgi:hypothetical protein
MLFPLALVSAAALYPGCKKQNSDAGSWTMAYGGAQDEEGYAVALSPDGGYIVAGELVWPDARSSDIYVLKVDDCGNEVWSATFGRTYYDVAYGVLATGDGGCIVTGSLYSEDFLNEACLLRISASGSEVWRRTYGGSYEDFARSIQPTNDGGYVIVGDTRSFGDGKTDIYLVKADASGNIVWQQAFGGTGVDHGRAVLPVTDGGYVVLGDIDDGDSHQICLVRTDAAGTRLWTSVFPGGGCDHGYALQPTTGGGYFIAGDSCARDGSDKDILLIATDSVGNKLWSRTYGGISPDWVNAARATADGGYVLVGCTESFGEGLKDVYLLKLNADGDTLWARTYGGIGREIGYSLQLAPDGGYLIAGSTDSYGGGRDDIWLVKTDSLGNVDQ